MAKFIIEPFEFALIDEVKTKKQIPENMQKKFALSGVYSVILMKC